MNFFIKLNMNEYFKILAIITFGIIIFLVGLFLGKTTTKTEIIKNTNEILKIDTLKETVVIEHKPIIISEVGKVKIVKDTVIISPEFETCIDSVYLRDTVKICYSFPQNRFDIDIKRFPDTVQNKILVITRFESKAVEEIWWRKPVYMLGAVVTGYALGKIK